MTNWQIQALMFGEHHKGVLAELAGVNKRTVQRWFNGSLVPPQQIIDKLDKTAQIWMNAPH